MVGKLSSVALDAFQAGCDNFIARDASTWVSNICGGKYDFIREIMSGILLRKSVATCSKHAL